MSVPVDWKKEWDLLTLIKGLLLLTSNGSELAEGGKNAGSNTGVGVLQLGQDGIQDGFYVGFDQLLRGTDQVAQQSRALFFVSAIPTELYLIVPKKD